MRTKLIFAVLLCVCSVSVAKKFTADSTGITVYNDNFGVVREDRLMNFTHGTNLFKFTDVASQIDPTSVRFQSLNNPDAIKVLEQNYEYDLVSKSKLLQKYIDKDIELYLKGTGSEPGQIIQGKLLSAVGGDLIIDTDQGMKIISSSSVLSISLGQGANGLITKPTLVWLVNSVIESATMTRTTYTTTGISWKADYLATLNEASDKIDLSGWVTINNKSGTSYKNASIKLMAGDVRRVQDRPEYRRNVRYKLAMESMADSAGGFAEKAFAEYHLYTLGRTSTINNNQIKQIEFITPALNVPCEKVFIYDWQRNAKKVNIKIEFENKEEFGLGIALPKGKVRVFKADQADGSLEFIGEDNIDHTARKEKLSLYIGNAFDIVPEHTLVDSKNLGHRAGFETRIEKHKVEIRNRKDTAVSVFVDEKFSKWVNWKITETNLQWEKKDATTARFKVDVPADSTFTLEYTTDQRW